MCVCVCMSLCVNVCVQGVCEHVYGSECTHMGMYQTMLPGFKVLMQTS